MGVQTYFSKKMQSRNTLNRAALRLCSVYRGEGRVRSSIAAILATLNAADVTQAENVRTEFNDPLQILLRSPRGSRPPRPIGELIDLFVHRTLFH